MTKITVHQTDRCDRENQKCEKHGDCKICQKKIQDNKKSMNTHNDCDSKNSKL